MKNNLSFFINISDIATTFYKCVEHLNLDQTQLASIAFNNINLFDHAFMFLSCTHWVAVYSTINTNDSFKIANLVKLTLVK